MDEEQRQLEEGLKDRGVSKELGTTNLEDHASSRRMLIGLRLPNRPKRPKKNRKHKRGDSDRTALTTSEFTAPTDVQSPTETVQSLLSEVDDEQHAPHPVFCQLDLLNSFGSERQWKEYARWVKYEEDVEEGGERWSKPHVASLSLHSLFELRSTILQGAVILDLDAYHITQIVDLVLDQVINNKMLEESLRDEMRKTLLAPHVFAHQKRKRSLMPGSDADIKKKKSFTSKGSSAKLSSNTSFPNMENGVLKESMSSAKLNVDFMRKVPDDAQACNVLVGEMSCLKYQLSAFVRLSEARTIGDITEIPIPTRFIFIMMGPPGSEAKAIELGRSFSTVMVDEIYREVAFKARNRQEVLSGLDEFLDQVTVLPPGEWDPKIRIEPPEKVPSQEARKTAKAVTHAGPHTLAVQKVEHESHDDPTLVRTGRLFGGLIEDVKRKIPFYISDYTDCLHIQCVASTIFLFLATLTPNVTFGGLLGQATDQYMGTMECILAASIVGILFALFAGQPLNILGSTGPMLVLEMILYRFCKDMGFDFLPLRCWIGLWTTFLILLVVAFDLSALVRYITRFTEESFACLIAIIFIYEAFKKQFHIIDHYGINPNPEVAISHECECFPPGYGENMTMDNVTTVMSTAATTAFPVAVTDVAYDVFGNFSNMTEVNYTLLNKTACVVMNGTLVGAGCEGSHYYPDVFFFSMLLFIGTFFLATTFKDFKTSAYFPTFVRQIVSDFSVLLSIVIMVGLDMLVAINTPKLEVPAKFQPTRYQDRGWIVLPYSAKNPWWTSVAAVVPAFLALVLIFMDQQITAVIVNRKENKLKKGNGYHLDMLVVAVCIAINSLLGLPWYVAATVSAIAHIMSLKKESESAAPGEKPLFLGCREQRVTALMVGILSGLAVFLTPVLTTIPMPVLYGVFLYMGVAALKGMQFMDRLGLLFMPAKYQPDLSYLRHVRIARVHMFTALQVLCLAILWVIKMVKSISIAFPVLVVGTCFVRKAMNLWFTQYELSYLDDLMPGDERNAEEDINGDDENLIDSGEKDDRELFMDMKMKQMMAGDKFGSYSPVATQDRVNITEEMGKTGIWMQNLIDSGEKDDRELFMDMKMKQMMAGDKFGSYSPVATQDRVNITEEMGKTGIWMQVRRESVPALDVMNNGSQKPLLTKRNGSNAKFTLGDEEDRGIPEEN